MEHIKEAVDEGVISEMEKSRDGEARNQHTRQS